MTAISPWLASASQKWAAYDRECERLKEPLRKTTDAALTMIVELCGSGSSLRERALAELRRRGVQ
jgi:hypothetical protein